MKRSLSVLGNGEVRLRLLEDKDLDKTLVWRNRDEVRCCFKHSSIISLEQHLKWFENYVKKDDDFIFVVEAGDEIVGQASVYGINWETKSAEVGRFMAAPDQSGKGYIRTACELLIEMCWSVLGLAYLFLEVFESNERAVRLYQSLGFKQESCDSGLLRFSLSCP